METDCTRCGTVSANGLENIVVDKDSAQVIKLDLKEGDTITLTFERLDVDDDSCSATIKDIKISN